MPYHPSHLRLPAWQIIAIATLIGLLVGTYIWSFRAGRAQTSEAREGPPPGPPAVTVPVVPVVPEPPGRPVP